MHNVADFMRRIQFVPGKTFGKAQCEPGWNWSPRALIDYDLWYAASGKGTMQISGRSYTISKGACFLVRKGDQPRATQDPDDRLVVIFIHFDIIWLNLIGADPSHAEYPPTYTIVEDSFYIERLLNRMLEALELNDPWTDVEFDSIMRQIWILLYRAHDLDKKENAVSQKQIQLISRVTRHIRQSSGTRIEHNQLAEMVRLSPQYLSVLFKKCVGISIKQYITQERLKRAMHLLTETSMNVSQVAEALEYTNIYSFSKQFKKYYNEPPSKFSMKSIESKPHYK